MKYRTLGRSGILVSEIGLGSEGFVGKSKEEALKMYDAALEAGINFFDLYNPDPDVRDHLGIAMKGRRERFIIQGHICTAWQNDQYIRTRDMKLVKEAYEDLFTRLQTDYIDIGMIHYLDEKKDFDEVFNGEVIEFAKQLKAEGKIRHIGMSCHNPKVAIEAVKTGLIDVLMFSINPAYDILPPNEDVNTLFEKETYEKPDVLSSCDPVRQELYSLCAGENVAITIMKPYGGGALLSAEESPFNVALSVPQCLHYCLTRPAAVSVLVGARSIEEMKEAAVYSELPLSEKDYASVLADAPVHAFTDKCMYCGHCAPCSVGIDVATVNKFYDLCIAQGMVPETVREHYKALRKKAGDCIGCGACESRCPFGVKIIQHMKNAKGLFGE